MVTVVPAGVPVLPRERLGKLAATNGSVVSVCNHAHCGAVPVGVNNSPLNAAVRSFGLTL